MTATPEQQLIGACLANPDLLRTASAITAGPEFRDYRLELAFDLMVRARLAGSPLDLTTFHLAARDAGIQGIDPAAPWAWHQEVWSVAEVTVERLAQAVHDEHVTREIARVVTAHNPTEQPVGEALSGMIESLTRLRSSSAGGALEGKNLGDLLQVPDDYDWLVRGLMERGDRLMLTGAEGAGKSMFVRQVAICLAAGVHPFQLTRIDPLRVLVIDAENSERQWKRATTGIVRSVLHSSPPADPREALHIVCTPRLDVTREAHIGAVHRKIDQYRPDLLCIGPLYKITSKAIQTDDEAAPVLTALDSIRDRGVSMIIEAHAGKGTTSAGDRNLAPRGSSALLGWPEFGIGLRLTDQDTEHGSRVVELSRWRGDRDVRDWPSRLTSAGPLPWNDEEIDPVLRRRFYAPLQSV